VLLRQVDRWIGLTKSLAKRLPDKRDPDKIEHSWESMLRQRIYALALGYEDLNDHDTLRKDLLWQTASERTEELASCSTLCRLENRAGRKEAWLMHEVLFEQFVGSFDSAPDELIVDFDCTDDRVHGLQEGRHFHGFYYDYCFLRCMSFVANSYWSATYAKTTSIRPNMLGRSWLCWSRRCENAGQRSKSSCGPTVAFADGRCCVGASERASTISSGWPRTSDSMRSRPSCTDVPNVSIRRLVAKCDSSLS
jgi:DDE family transposase